MNEQACNNRFAIETLEGRRLMSTVVNADFNNDGYVDKATITDPTTIVVSLADGGGGYTVSATLKTPRNQPVTDIDKADLNADGKWDIVAVGSKNSGSYSVSFGNNGDGTFRYIEPFRWKGTTKWWI